VHCTVIFYGVVNALLKNKHFISAHLDLNPQGAEKLFIPGLNFIIKCYVLTLFTILIIVNFLNVCVRFKQVLCYPPSRAENNTKQKKYMN
jgi:hypothetical protein